MLPFLDHTTEAFAADPYGVLRSAREESWIVRTPTGLGVVSYAGCSALLLHSGFRPGVFEFVRRADPRGRAAPTDRTLLGSEGADHRHLRRVVMPWFTPRRIEALREQTVLLVESLVDGVTAAGGCEFMSDIARRIPPMIFCWMVGCDVERGPELARTSAVALQAFSGDPAAMDDVVNAIRELRRFADELIEEKQRSPGDDITSALVAGIEQGVMSHRDARSLLTELLGASVENTTHTMGLALWLLCRHPDQWALVARDADLIERAVEECARYEPVIRYGNHFNDDAADLLGFRVPAGTLTTIYLTSAHRDPDVFENPDRFDVTRRLPQPQLNFGIGRHFCIGAPLARMEIQEVLRAITARWADPRLGAGTSVSRAHSSEVDLLPVDFTPIRRA